MRSFQESGQKRIALVSMMMLAGLGGLAITGIPATAAPGVGPDVPQPGTAEVVKDETDPLTQRAVLLTERLNPRDIAPVWVDRSANQVVVGMTSATPSISRSVVSDSAKDAGNSMRLANVKYTLGNLEGFRDTIDTGRAELKAAGFDLGRVGLRPPVDKVAVEVLGNTDVTSEAASAIAKAFAIPLEALTVEMGNPVSADNAKNYCLRVDDCTPWSSSINLRRTGTQDCSAGPGVMRGGHEYLLTASHCYSVGQWVYNGRIYFTPATTDDTKIGVVSSASTASGGVDAELIDPDSSLGTANTMYTDWNTYASMSSVVAVATIAGGNVCVNGALTGARCSAAINTDWVDYSAIREGRLVSHLVDVYRGEGQAAGYGDSGGPVYVAMTPRRYIGIITGDTGRGTPDGDELCDAFPNTTDPGLYRICRRDITFTSLQGILDYYSSIGPTLTLAP